MITLLHFCLLVFEEAALIKQPCLFNMNNCISKYNYTLAKQTRLLYRFSNALLKISNFETILNTAAYETIHAMSANTVSIALLNNEGDKLVVEIIKRKDGTNKKPSRKEFKLGEGAAGTAAQEQKIVNISDIEKSSIFIGKCQSHARSLICVPMMFQKKLVGVLSVSLGTGKRFSKQDEEFLIILTTIIAGSIQNSRLYRNLEDEGKKITNIIKNISEAILVINSKYEIVLKNNAFDQILEKLSKNPEINPDEIKKFCKKWKTPFLKSQSFELKLKDTDNQDFWLKIYTSIITDEEEQNLLAVIRDVTKEKIFENKQKEFIYSITHELRTPITAIKGYLSMILNGDAGKINQKQEAYFSRVYRSTSKLINLVEDILQTARIENDKINYNIARVDARNLVDEVANDFYKKASDKGLELIVKPSGNLALKADYEKTLQILANIVDNAIKYTRKGRITLSIEKNKNIGIIKVKDTGVGLDKKDIAEIFKKFYRVPNSQAIKEGGTGLGLFIAKNMIKKQGGDINVINSKIGKGSEFAVQLPIYLGEK